MRRRTKVAALVLIVLLIAALAVVGLWATGNLSGLGLGSGIFGDRVAVNQDTPAQTYALRGGTYEVTWHQTGCARIRTSIEQVGGSFRKTHGYSGVTNVPTASESLSEVPAGDYRITQTEAECTSWEITVERTGD